MGAAVILVGAGLALSALPAFVIIMMLATGLEYMALLAVCAAGYWTVVLTARYLVARLPRGLHPVIRMCLEAAIAVGLTVAMAVSAALLSVLLYP
jgi:hypothetical protein